MAAAVVAGSSDFSPETKLTHRLRSDSESSSDDHMLSGDDSPNSQKCTCNHSDEEDREDCEEPCCKNIGKKLLKKQGWKEGQGLGKNLQGPIDALSVKKKSLGSERSDDDDESDTDGSTEGRKLLECEKENTEELIQKYKENQEKAQALEESLADLKSSMYCEQCSKQYTKYTEFENHMNSYDHAHIKRLKELKQKEIGRQLGGLKQRDDKTNERDFLRLNQYADSRIDRSSDSEPGVDSECTTVFFDDETPDMPPLPTGINIMDNICPDDIPLPPIPLPPDINNHQDSSNSDNDSPQNVKTAEKTMVSFAMKRISVIPVKSVFKAAEEEERKLKLPKKKKVSERKTLKEELEREKKREEEKKIEEMNLEELYPSMQSADDKPQHRYPMKTFVKSDSMLGNPGTNKHNSTADSSDANAVKHEKLTNGQTDAMAVNDVEENLKKTPVKLGGIANKQAAIVKHDLLEFISVTSLNDDRVLEWPGEMVQYSSLEPKICFSCNPLSFDFSILSIKPQLLLGAQALSPSGKKKKEKKGRRKKKKKKSGKSKKSKKEKGENEEKEVNKDGAEKEVKPKSKKKKKRSRSKKKRSKKHGSESETDGEQNTSKTTEGEADHESKNAKTNTDGVTSKGKKKGHKKSRKSSRRRSSKKNKKGSESETEGKSASKNAEAGEKDKQKVKASKRSSAPTKDGAGNQASGESDGEDTKGGKGGKRKYRKRKGSEIHAGDSTDSEGGGGTVNKAKKKKKGKKKEKSTDSTLR